MRRRLQLRFVDGTSVLHRLRADTKIITIAALATAFVFRPDWPIVGLGWALVLALFVLSRLPTTVLAPPPPIFFWVMAFGGVLTLFSGGEPIVAGVELGGFIDFVRFLAVGLLVISLSARLAWTTRLSDVGLGLGRMMRPLRLVRLPADELATVVMLAARSIPMVRDELWVTVDARAVRPRPPGKRSVAEGIRDAVDFGATVLVGAHRRSREMAKAMAARGSDRAPVPTDQAWRALDWITVTAAVGGAVAIVVLG